MKQVHEKKEKLGEEVKEGGREGGKEEKEEERQRGKGYREVGRKDSCL